MTVSQKTLEDISHGFRLDVSREGNSVGESSDSRWIYLIGKSRKIYARAGGSSEAHGYFEKRDGHFWGSVRPVKIGPDYRDEWGIDPSTFETTPVAGNVAVIVEGAFIESMAPEDKYDGRIIGFRPMVADEQEACKTLSESKSYNKRVYPETFPQPS